MEIRKVIRDGSLLWLGLVLFVALCIAFLLPVTSEDFWWYLRVGQDTIVNRAVPVIDTLTYSVYGQPLYYHSWGAAVIFWWLYQLGNLTLIVLMRGILIAITYTLVWFAARKQGAGRIGSSLILLFAVLASSNNWAIRPQLLTYPLFAWSIWILYRWQDGNKRQVWFLPLIAFLWGNLHASYVILLALIFTALVFGKGNKRQLIIVTIVGLAAMLLNPRGWHSYEYILNVFQLLISPSNQQYSAEWKPPVNEGWQMNLFFLWFIALPILTAFSPRRLSKLEWSWFVVFGIMALWGLRYGIWFILILVKLTAVLIADWEYQRIPEPARSHSKLNSTLFVSLILISLAMLPGIRERWWKASPLSTENTPIAATFWLRDHPQLQGPLFSEIGFASYLEFAHPNLPVWIDSRIFPFPVEMWENYVEINNAAWDWESRLDTTNANLIMVSVNKQPKLVKALQQSSRWCQLYGDDIAQIYSQADCTP